MAAARANPYFTCMYTCWAAASFAGLRASAPPGRGRRLFVGHHVHAVPVRLGFGAQVVRAPVAERSRGAVVGPAVQHLLEDGPSRGPAALAIAGPASREQFQAPEPWVR